MNRPFFLRATAIATSLGRRLQCPAVLLHLALALCHATLEGVVPIPADDHVIHMAVVIIYVFLALSHEPANIYSRGHRRHRAHLRVCPWCLVRLRVDREPRRQTPSMNVIAVPINEHSVSAAGDGRSTSVTQARNI
jgi:hypothetical protein